MATDFVLGRAGQRLCASHTGRGPRGKSLVSLDGEARPRPVLGRAPPTEPRGNSHPSA